MVSLHSITPTSSREELLRRAQELAGCTLGELALRWGKTAPAELRRAKGWVGQLVETALGATAASRAEPDFPHLGIELKTIPVTERGKPVESTFVCTIELAQMDLAEWESSRVKTKLQNVLWVPVEGSREIPVAARRLGSPFLWSPDEEETQLLRGDWEELCTWIARGKTGEITGHLGRALQVRPKAARGSSRRRTLDEEGALYEEQPKGFYLRASFTWKILQKNLLLPSR